MSTAIGTPSTPSTTSSPVLTSQSLNHVNILPSNQSHSSQATDGMVPSLRFTVDVKATSTAKVYFENLLQLAKQNVSLQHQMKASNKVSDDASQKNKKRKRKIALNDDEEDGEKEDDENKVIELESSDEEGEDDDMETGVEESGNSNSEGEIKFGDEGKQTTTTTTTEEPKKKRLRKTRETAFNLKNLSTRDPEDLDWDILRERNTHISRLGALITNIEARDRLLKNDLIKKTIKRKGNDYVEQKNSSVEEKNTNGRKGDFYVYSSEDDFIDDSEYNDYLCSDEGEEFSAASSSRKSSDFYVVSKVSDNISDYDSEHSSGSLEDEEDEIDNHGLEIQHIPKDTKATVSDDLLDETIEPELEAALEELKKKAATLEKQTFQSIPHELDEDLLKIAILREQYYKRGVPRKLLNRLKAINGLRFTDKTIKDRLKLVLKKFSTDSLTNEMDNLKDQFKQSVVEDMRRALQNKKEKDAKAKKDSTSSASLITSNKEEDYSTMSHEDLKKSLNDIEGVRVVWSKSTTDLFLKLCQTREDWVSKENEIKKSNKKGDLLDVNEELLKLFKELKSYLYKSQDLMKKYKTLKEKDNKKEESKDKNSDSVSGKKEESKKEEKKEESTTKKRKSEGSGNKKEDNGKTDDSGKKKDDEKDSERKPRRRKYRKSTQSTSTISEDSSSTSTVTSSNDIVIDIEESETESQTPSPDIDTISNITGTPDVQATVDTRPTVVPATVLADVMEQERNASVFLNQQ